MKRIYQIAIAALFMTGGISSCSLDEWNPSTVDLETAYKYKEGYESLINYCYDGLYYFYGKVDGVGAMEMGTDLWANVSNTESGFILYNSNMNTQLGTLKTIWQGFYATVNYCNTAIHYAKTVEGYTEDELKARVAEAHFLRAFSNWHLVEQFGGVTLTTEPSTATGPVNSPTRSTEEEFYDLIISDLQFAVDNLPISQGQEVGRINKGAAYAMMAKVCLQRTRLGEKETYAKKSLEAAQELINNQSKYGIALYQSDENQSGYEKLWDGKNNKTNTEFIFREYVDHLSGKNPEGWNRGRTRQLYLMDCKTAAKDWGPQENDAWLSRANNRPFKPTKYLLTEIFEPVPDPADTRFKASFWYEYYNATWGDKTITAKMCTEYGKNPTLATEKSWNSAGEEVDGRVILNTAGTRVGVSWVAGKENQNAFGFTNMDVDRDGDGYSDGLGVFTPNWNMSTEDKYNLPFWIVDPADMFDADGKWVQPDEKKPLNAKAKDVYPSLKKFSALEFVYDRQYWMGDFPIIRLGEIYLIAAEAALLSSNDQTTAANYVNTIRRRCAVTSRQAEMEVGTSAVTLDFILAERGRELAGEQTRWYDLKRMGKLTTEYLTRTNPDIQFFDPKLHTLRPIPQSFLDAIANPEEYGSNGYLD